MSGEQSKGINAQFDVGKEETRDLITAIADTFSPISEGLGAIGDKFRYYRAESAIENFKKAQEKAEQAGITLKAPPIRFLAPYIEMGSTNEQNNQTVSDMWANLLFSAGKNYNERQIRFIRLLSEMSESEANLFNKICTYKSSYFKRPETLVDDAFGMWTAGQIRPLLNQLHEIEDVHEIYEFLQRELDFPGSILYELLVYDSESSKLYDISRDGITAEFDESIFSSLSTTNLIEYNRSFLLELENLRYQYLAPM